jgi:hypothetical protein
MRLVYAPEGQPEPTTWAVDLGKLRTMEVEAIERLTGLDYGSTFKERLLKGNSLARRALLFTLQRRQHPTLKFADVDFADDELRLEFGLAELQAMRSAVEEAPSLTDDERVAALAELDKMIDAEQPDAALGSAEGKAL